MSSVSWLTSHECSVSIIQSSDDSNAFSVVLHWLEFIFLSPCPQRILVSSIDLLFLLTLLALVIQRLYSRFSTNGNSGSTLSKPLIGADTRDFRVTVWFKVSFIVTVLLALSYVVLCVLSFIHGVQSQWDLVETLFKLVQAMTHIGILILLAHEKKFRAVSHPLPLRIFWILNFVVMSLISAAALTRLFSTDGNKNQEMKVDDAYSLASLPLYGFLFIVAVRGSSGIRLNIECEVDDNSIRDIDESTLVDSNVSGYATASFFSRAIWYWMNPLLSKGYKSPLKMDEVPSLSPTDRAEKMAELFELNWPNPTEISKNPVRTMLLRCFWKDLALTGSLAIVRLAVMYVGPVLIQSFISFTSGEKHKFYEGVFLILILLIAKIIEVLSSHHFNFLSQKLGMLIRSTLITALYQKGLKLSCSSRQAHGVGQIVNYMAVDCQQLADLVYQLHTLWLMPFQVGVALLLLYVYMGVSVLVSLVAVIGVMILTFMITRKNNSFQFNIMKNRDVRMKETTELLNNMRVIKFQAWEEHFKKKIQSSRGKEYSWLSKFMYLLAGNLILLWSIPSLLAALTFAVATLMRVPLDAGRLDGYLISGELENKSVEREEGSEGRISVEVTDGSFSWDDEGGHRVLEDVNFEIRKGELAAIVGTVGSGKSSLLAAVLGELRKTSGKVRVCGTTACVAQTSWIQNATIQENILFGSPMDSERYNRVIQVCSLEKDLEIMEHGDQTEIGERGINLSGGQKQRIQLARAVYQDCDIYLLDDIFSAVDAQTGSEIFKECVRGVLKDKTILLVTHQVDFLHNADLILVLRDGKIVQSGKYEELRQSGLDFSALVAAHETSMELVETSTNVSVVNPKHTPESPHKPSPKSPKNILSQSENGENRSLDQSNSDKDNSKLIEDEERETGRVSLAVYRQYCTEAYGWWGVAAAILASILWQGSLITSDYWLAYETSGDRIFNPSLFINVYSILALIACVFVAIRSVLVSFLGLKTAQSFFNQILDSILHAPMSFFDTTPSGRVLSRASADQANVDFLIPLFMSVTLVMYFSLLSILVITCQYAWPTIFIIIPLIWLNIWYQGYYIASSRELTRLEQITKAPVIHHFSETISGVMTIRCFRKQEKFFQENVNRVNANLRMNFHNNASNEWLGFRLELFGCFVLCIAAAFLILLPSTIIRPAYVGLSLSYGLPLNSVLYWTIYLSSFLENRMVSVERIKQFINIPAEAVWKKENTLPSADWPNHGDIEIKELQVRYRPNTPLVLKGISLSIHGGEKVGVVGRTGSGKSTLIQVFFRSRFGIIPQEPVLFEGTVRSNIDPLGLYSDDEIWKSLERCQLKEVVSAKPEKLDALVVDSGDNWSVGQRQLLCLGRVMLKRSRILFMDEATASVDSQTDVIIQKIIRQEFLSCTIITIAHRIPTVIDCDRVLVIDDGWAKEFGISVNPSQMGALTINRKRGDDYFKSPAPTSPSFDRSYAHVSKKPKLPNSMNQITVDFDRPLSAKSVNSRISQYPDSKPRFMREVHAPVRSHRFGLSAIKNKIVSSLSLEESSSVRMGNIYGTLKFRLEKAKISAMKTFRYVGKENESVDKEKEKEVIEIDDEKESQDDMSENLSVQEVEVVDFPRINLKEGNGVLGNSREFKGKMVERNLHSLDSYVVSDTSGVNVKVDSTENMDLMLLNQKPDLSGVPVHRKLYDSAKKRNDKLNSLSFAIELEEKSFQRLQLLRPQKKVEDTNKHVSKECFMPITVEEEAEVARALSNSNRRKVLVSHKNSNIDITGEILQCLKPGAWLNDEVINLYLELLKEREKREPQKFLKCHFFNTFFYKKVTDVEYEVIEGDARNVMCDAVKKFHASVLALGSHGYGTSKRYV
ncbi:unnamed protein product [Fraxinus pennsylvanica]|uniref:ABC-type xenobiotic transporter n=1 Tax=Fraxinus pennsylvanica TaxID=56036 RepID=A0AAD1ZL46_9LAMI|nr:unnamed protein product [Fraxinus pennsylvanica]